MRVWYVYVSCCPKDYTAKKKKLIGQVRVDNLISLYRYRWLINLQWWFFYAHSYKELFEFVKSSTLPAFNMFYLSYQN